MLSIIIIGHPNWPQNHTKGGPRTFPEEIVFWLPLTVPREFVGHGQGEPVPELLLSLCDTVADVQLVPPVHHASPANSLSKSLSSAKIIFIRHDGHKLPLQPRYDGPFCILAPRDKSSKFRSAIMRRPFLLIG